MTFRPAVLVSLTLLFACAAQSSGAESKASAAAMSPGRRQLERNERVNSLGTPEDLTYSTKVYSSEKTQTDALIYAGEFLAASDEGFYLAQNEGTERVAFAKHIKSLQGESLAVRQPRAGELQTGQVVYYSLASTLAGARTGVWFRGAIDHVDPIMGTITIGKTRVDPKQYVLLRDK